LIGCSMERIEKPPFEYSMLTTKLIEVNPSRAARFVASSIAPSL
jgi:hypothetical protein